MRLITKHSMNLAGIVEMWTYKKEDVAEKM
jgi:hypothetical protein